MQDHYGFWNLGALSDRQLLERVGVMLGSTRRLTAELIAHLGEVEERRLHLVAACSSMFAYCLKLGMTEDEAYRRIEVARLARRYPAIFPLLANGQLSISVVALLKHHLSLDNHAELLADVRGKSVAQTRELIATRFPRPDVASSVRKLPEPRTTFQPSFSMSDATQPRARVEEPNAGGTEPRTGGMESNVGGTEPNVGGTESNVGGTEPRTRPPQPHSRRVTPPRVPSRIEPLSAKNYKVQFTASAELARKLEVARDLMRHSYPGGELGAIVERALDMLIESMMRRRFGKKASPKRTSARARRIAPEHQRHVTDAAERDIPTHGPAGPNTAKMREGVEDAAAGPDTSNMREGIEDAAATMRDAVHPHTATMRDAASTATRRDAAHPNTATTREAAAVTMREGQDVQADVGVEGKRAFVSSYTPRSSRRTVVERDGLGCSWVDEQGTRCGSRAWLEYDHRHPRAKGGGSEPDNLRLLCRNHNRFAAEREYGRTHVERTIAERQCARAPRGARDMTG